MHKYLTVFAIDWQNQFIYRFNFLLWRFRNILRLVMTYYLWNTIFAARLTAFGYTREQMMAYIFLSLFVTSLVLSAPSNDSMGGEIGSGDLSNFLVKPINYLKYWFTRDLSSKLLNVLMSLIEVTVLWLLFKPAISLSSEPVYLLSGFLLLVLGTFLYFLFSKLAIFVTFWTPENTWGLMFLILVCLEMLSGMIFPLDILPPLVQTILQFTPFPYLVYYPIAILIGQVPAQLVLPILIKAALWVLVSGYLVRLVWSKGLKTYSAVGR